MAHKVIVPPKKIMSQSFLNSGTLIVIFPDRPSDSAYGEKRSTHKKYGVAQDQLVSD
jgi:hypothetical protein